jgi:uracil-DNA glycosylase family 4
MTCGKIDFKCTRCRLSEGRTQVVPGNGPCDSKIFFIGEAPGKDEDLKGVPFVGRAGKVLDDAIEKARARRDQVFVGNLVKCRPPDNRKPRRDEIEECSIFLESELKEVSPRVICALGQTAANHLLNTKDKISDLAGTEIPLTIAGKKVRLFVTFHPAACLYQRKNLEKFQENIKRCLETAGVVKTGPMK